MKVSKCGLSVIMKMCEHLDSFEFSNQCIVENVSGCERRGSFPLKFQGSGSHMRGDSLCPRCLQECRSDDI